MAAVDYRPGEKCGTIGGMQALVKEVPGGVIVVHLKGEVDLDSSEPFHKTCMQNLPQKNIVFNLKDLNFVGSNGLSSFLNTVKDLGKCAQLKFCCVGSEFRRMMLATEDIQDRHIYEDERSATLSFQDGKCPGMTEGG